MEGKIILLLDGFSRKEAEEALAVYAEWGGEASRVVAAPVTEHLTDTLTARAVEDVAAGRWPGGAPRTGGKRGALIAGGDKAQSVGLMRAFRKVLPKDADAAFAMVTATGETWTVGEYLAHIRKEHEFMKTADPSADPDMRPVED